MLTRVLLVDDHRVLTDLLALGLDGQPDMRCAGAAHTGAEAVALSRRVGFDVALVDLQLPDGGGLDLVGRLLVERPGARVVVLTAHPRPEPARRAVELGAAGFLGKDLPLPGILDAIRTVVAGGRVLDPAVDAGVGALGVPRMTPRERDVLAGLARGADVARLATELGLSRHTVRDHVRSVLAKLGARTQLEAVVAAEGLGLVRLGPGG